MENLKCMDIWFLSKQIGESTIVSFLTRLQKFWYIRSSLISAAVQLSLQLRHFARVSGQIKKQKLSTANVKIFFFSHFKISKGKQVYFLHTKKVFSYMRSNHHQSFSVWLLETFQGYIWDRLGNALDLRSLHEGFSTLTDIIVNKSTRHLITALLVETLLKEKDWSYSLANVSFNDNAFSLPVLYNILWFHGNHGNHSFLFWIKRVL